MNQTGQGTATSSNRRWISAVLQAFASALIVVVIINFVTLDKFAKAASMLSLTPFIESCIPLTILLFIGALNLFLLLSVLEEADFWIVTNAYLSSFVFGLFTPVALGEFASLTVILAGKGASIKNVLSALTCDKILMLVVNWLGFLVGLFMYFSVPWLLAPALIVMTILGLLLLGTLSDILGAFLLSKSKNISRLAALLNSLNVLARKFRPVLFRCLILDAAKGFCVGVMLWIFMTSIGADIGFTTVIMLNFVSRMVCYIPISLNGIGLLEGTAAFVFTKAGIPPEISVLAFVSVQGLWLILCLTPNCRRHVPRHVVCCWRWGRAKRGVGCD